MTDYGPCRLAKDGHLIRHMYDYDLCVRCEERWAVPDQVSTMISGPLVEDNDDALYERLGYLLASQPPWDGRPWAETSPEEKEHWRLVFAAILCHLVDDEGWTPGTPEVCPLCHQRFTEENDACPILHGFEEDGVPPAAAPVDDDLDALRVCADNDSWGKRDAARLRRVLDDYDRLRNELAGLKAATLR